MFRCLSPTLLGIGVLLIGIACGAFAWTTNQSRFNPFIEDVLCDDHETLLRTSHPTTYVDEDNFTREGEDVDYYCLDQSKGRTRDITTRVYIVVGGLVLPPLVVGLVLAVVGWRKMGRPGAAPDGVA